MVRTVAEGVARTRAALVLVLAGLASLVAVAAVEPSGSAQALVVLGALSAATATVGLHCLLTVPAAGLGSLLPPRRSADVPLVLAGRSTDVVHHPARPRAPGQV